jgi:hypothetical protein
MINYTERTMKRNINQDAMDEYKFYISMDSLYMKA